MPETPENFRPVTPATDSTTSEAMRASLERMLAEVATAGAEPLPPPVPDHTLLRCVGSGAYGEVWLARNALGTLRAVKVVHRARFKEDRPYEREFHGILKYEPISRSHEGLVQVLHVGRAEGCFYYMMELADAEEVEREKGGKGERETNVPSAQHIAEAKPPFPLSPLLPIDPGSYSPRTLRSELASRPRLPPVEAAQFALRLAIALGHLHAHGLVHRDIKPSNVIFVGGHPKLADIGLVTDVGSSHSFVGTEGFIPPEGPGTQQADLYALGKLLYELATGRDRMDFPQLPPDVTKSPDGDALLELNEVMTRACAPEARNRYASATELQADLNLFLAGRSLRRARSVELHLVRLKRLALAACTVMALAAGIVWYAKMEERRAKNQAQVETTLRQRAETAEQETQRQLYTALFEQARNTVRSGEVGQRVRALDALQRAAAISNTVELRREAWRALATPDLRFKKEIPTGPDISSAALDPDFSRVALCLPGGPVEIRSVADGRLLTTLPANTRKMGYPVRWSPDGRFVVVTRREALTKPTTDIEVWDVAGARRTAYLYEVPAGAMSFHPSRPELMVAEEEGVAILDAESGAVVARHGLPSAPRRLAYSPDGRYYAAALLLDRRWSVSIRDITRNQKRSSFETINDPRVLAWHPNSRLIAFPISDSRLLMADVQNEYIKQVGRHKGAGLSAAFSPDGNYLLSCDTDGDWVCWACSGLQVQFTAGGQSLELQFSRDGRQCALGSVSSVKIHDFERPVCERELIGSLGHCAVPAAFSPDGQWVAVPGDNMLGVWNLTTNTLPALVPRTNTITTPFFSPVDSELFVSTRSAVHHWRPRMETNESISIRLEAEPSLKPGAGAQLYSAVLRSNELVLNVTEYVVFMPLANATTGEGRRLVRANDGYGVVSADGQWLCLRLDQTPRIEVFRLPEMTPVLQLTNRSLVFHTAFNPHGDELAVVTRTGIVFLETGTWRQKRELQGEMGIYSVVRYAPDGRMFWLNRDLRNAALYDNESLRERLVTPTGMLPLALAPDGRRLLVAVDGSRLQVWDVPAMKKRLQEMGMGWDAAQ